MKVEPILSVTPIRGTHYRLQPGEFSLLVKPGDQLYLKPEPENEYDRSAVAIYCRDKKAEVRAAEASLDPNTREWKYRHIGYVPKELTGLVHEAIALGMKLSAVAEGGQNFSLDGLLDEDEGEE